MQVKHFVGLVIVPMFLVSCSAESYVADADAQVEAILLQKQWDHFQRSDPFTIEMDPNRLRNVMILELKAIQAREQERLREQMGLAAENSRGGKGGLRVAQEQPPAGADPGTQQETAPDDSQERPDSGDASQDTPPQETDEGPTAIEEGIEPPADAYQELELSLADIERRYADLLVLPRPTELSPLPERVLSLLDALKVASSNSRDYQRQEESVYLSALDLTLERYRFETQYGVSSSYQWTSSEGTSGSSRERSGQLDTSFSFTRMLASGGFLVFDFTNSLIRRFTGFGLNNGSSDTGSTASVSFTQPLLQGFGPDIVQEPLTQSERDVVYALRVFERFRRSFAVDIANDYYGLLQSLDAIHNARRNYLQVIHSREQAQAFAELGRRSQIDTDRARSAELQSRDSWIRAVLNYEDALDRFKVTLGLPIEANIAPDTRELQRLSNEGMPENYPAEAAGIDLGLRFRLDYRTAIDQAFDSRRRVNVTADQLKTVLDLNGSYTVGTDRNTAFDLTPGDATWSAGLDLDLPIERLQERNSYRRALIAFEQQKRAMTLAADQVKQDVRRGLRRLAQQRESYKITVDSVQVAERRVEATNLEVRQGKAEVLDALDATADLVQSKNQLTATLINVRIELLTLFLNTGLLRLTEEGIQYAVPEPNPGTEPSTEEEP